MLEAVTVREHAKEHPMKVHGVLVERQVDDTPSRHIAQAVIEPLGQRP